MQIKMGYQITKVLDIGQSSSLKSDVQYCLTYILAALRFTEMVLSFQDATFNMGHVPAF